MCLRALGKILNQLVDSKEQAELLNATALQPLDGNADGTYANTVEKLYTRPPGISLSIRDQ